MNYMKQAVVLYSISNGIYLGSCLGLGFWSKLDSIGLNSACTFENEADAQAHMNEWEMPPPEDVRCVDVVEDEPGFASISACIAAGLPAWNPIEGLH